MAGRILSCWVSFALPIPKMKKLPFPCRPPPRFTVGGTSGELRYVGPGEDFEANPNQLEVTVVAIDALGGAAQAAITVQIVNVNERPVVADDALTVAEDLDARIEVLTNDSDPDAGDQIRVVSVGSAEHGQASLVENGAAVRYAPDPNFHGSDQFTYTVSDIAGLTDTATVRVTATAVNDEPDASDDQASTQEDMEIEIPVLSNDMDLDGDSLHVQSVSSPEHGVAKLEPVRARVTYIPDPNYHGADRFTYVVADAGGLTDTATVRVTVASINDAPVASDDQAVTSEDESVEIPVLDNDEDPDGDLLRVQSISSAEHGTPAISPDGTAVSYIPDPDYNGPNMFTYIVADADGLSDTAMVAVDVTPVNDGPAALDQIPDQMLDEGGSEKTIELTPYFTDADGDPLTFSTESSDPSIVTAVIRGVELVLAPVASGGVAVTVTATDRGGLAATQRVSVGVSDQPVREVLGDAFAALARSHLASIRMTLERRATNRTTSGPTGTSLQSGLRVGGRPVLLPNRQAIRSMAQRIALGWLPANAQMGNPTADRTRASRMPGAMAVPGIDAPLAHTPAGFRNPLHLAVPVAGMSDMDFTFTWTGPFADSLRPGIIWSAWGQCDLQRYGGMATESGSNAGNYTGNLNIWYLRVDAQLSDWLFGIAMGRSQGEGDWAVGTAAGQLITTLTSVYPYLRWSHGATSIWATAGMGRGEARNERATGRIGTSPLSLALGLLDYRRQLGSTDGPVAFGIRADAGWTSLSTDEGTATINDIQARVHQARLGLDVKGELNIGRAGLAPFGAVHARYDGGDGQTGQGIAVSGGLQARFSLIGLGLQDRWLAIHSATDYEESGVGVTLTVGGQNEEGFSLSASPYWGGHTRAGVALWPDRVPGIAQGLKVRPQGWTLDVHGAYRGRLRDRKLEISTGYENGWGGPNLQLTRLISL